MHKSLLFAHQLLVCFDVPASCDFFKHNRKLTCKFTNTSITLSNTKKQLGLHSVRPKKFQVTGQDRQKYFLNNFFQ